LSPEKGFKVVVAEGIPGLFLKNLKEIWKDMLIGLVKAMDGTVMLVINSITIPWSFPAGSTLPPLFVPVLSGCCGVRVIW